MKDLLLDVCLGLTRCFIRILFSNFYLEFGGNMMESYGTHLVSSIFGDFILNFWKKLSHVPNKNIKLKKSQYFSIHVPYEVSVKTTEILKTVNLKSNICLLDVSNRMCNCNPYKGSKFGPGDGPKFSTGSKV
jgi:hypothetical protein